MKSKKQLTNLYGDDADTFLPQSLLNTVRKTDLNHAGPKAALIFVRKIDAASRSNFSNIFANLYFLTRTMTFHQLLTSFFDSFCSTFGLP